MAPPVNRKGRCKVCAHVDRARIEDLRGAGVAFQALAEKFGVASTILKRHWADHVTPGAKAAYRIGPTTLDEARERAAAEGGSVVDYFGITRSILFAQLLRQHEADSAQGVATVAGRIVDVLRELGKISGEIMRETAPSTTVNVFNGSPVEVALLQGLLAIADRHPEAGNEIIALLDHLNGTAPAMHRLAPVIQHEAAHA